MGQPLQRSGISEVITSSPFEHTHSVHLVNLLVLVLGVLAALLLFEDSLAVLIKLKSSDDTVAWVDWNVGLLTVGLLLNDFLNVNASASAVDRVDFAFVVTEAADHDLDLVALADWDGADLVLVTELAGKVAAHHDSADAAWGGEVGLS